MLNLLRLLLIEIWNLCSKAKLSALSRAVKLLSFNKRRTLFEAFVDSQFKYCLILWMFHSRHTNDNSNWLHQRALRIVYDDDVSTFDQLLVMDKYFCIHHQNIGKLKLKFTRLLMIFLETFERIICEKRNHKFAVFSFLFFFFFYMNIVHTNKYNKKLQSPGALNI